MILGENGGTECSRSCCVDPVSFWIWQTKLAIDDKGFQRSISWKKNNKNQNFLYFSNANSRNQKLNKNNSVSGHLITSYIWSMMIKKTLNLECFYILIS